MHYKAQVLQFMRNWYYHIFVHGVESARFRDGNTLTTLQETALKKCEISTTYYLVDTNGALSQVLAEYDENGTLSLLQWFMRTTFVRRLCVFSLC